MEGAAKHARGEGVGDKNNHVEELGQFKVRHATKRERAKVRAFYETNWSTNLARRGERWVTKATAEREVFIVEEQSTRAIVAASAIKQWKFPPTSRMPEEFYIEAAASLVPKLRMPNGRELGFGGFDPSFHDIFHSARAVTALLHEPEVAVRCKKFAYCGAVLKGGDAERLRKAIRKAGFKDWDPAEKLVKEKGRVREEQGEASRGDVDWFMLPESAVRRHAKQLIGWASGIEIVRTNRDTKKRESLRVILDLEVLRFYYGDVVALSEGASIRDLAASPDEEGDDE